MTMSENEFITAKCIHNTYIAIVHLESADYGSDPVHTETIAELRTKLQHMWQAAMGASMMLTFHNNPKKDHEIWTNIVECAFKEAA